MQLTSALTCPKCGGVATETSELGPIAVPKLETSTVESVLELEPGSAAVLPLPGDGETRMAFLIEVFVNG